MSDGRSPAAPAAKLLTSQLVAEYVTEFAGATPDDLAAMYPSTDRMEQAVMPNGRSGGTVHSKMAVLRRFAADVPTIPCARGEIVAHIARLKLGLNTRRKHLRQIKAFLNWLEEAHGIPPPQLKRLLPKPDEPEYVTLTEEQANAAIGCAKNHMEGMMLQLMFATGLRTAELCNLRQEHVKDDHIVIHGKGRKVREVPIEPDLRDAIRQTLGQEHLFWDTSGRPLGRSGCYQRVHDAFRRAGLDLTKMGGHVIRHTFATLVIKHTGDIRLTQQLLGHSQITTTAIYAKHLQEDVRAKMGQLRLMDRITGNFGNDAA